MTTIAYKKGLMVADSRAYSGGRDPIGEKCKIECLADGTLLGVTCTIPGGGEAIRRWYKDGCPKECDYHLPEQFTLLAVRPDGSADFANDAKMISGPIFAKQYAIGSGADYALGAMVHHADARQALAVAIELDVWSDFPIYILGHDGIVIKEDRETD